MVDTLLHIHIKEKRVNISSWRRPTDGHNTGGKICPEILEGKTDKR